MTVAKRHIEPVPAFADLFDKSHSQLSGKSADIIDWRRGRFSRFNATGIPSQRHEPWKFTNISKVANQPMRLAPRQSVGLDVISRYFAGGPMARRMIFVNGHLVPEISHILGLSSGVRIQSLADLMRDEPDSLLSTLDQLNDDRSFTDLNAAFLNGGALVEVPNNVVVEQPIQLLFLTVGEAAATMVHPRIIVKLGDGAALKLIELHAASGPGQVLTNMVSQISVGEGATLTHDRVQLGRSGTTFVGKGAFELAGSATLKQTLAILGGSLVRNELDLRLNGEQIDAQLNGVFMPTTGEHVDTMIQMHHLQPNCESDQFYKGVLAGKGHGAFAGKIFVHRGAQQTNAYQTNNNLVLSDDARIDSKPELEIYADDVKCSHGATFSDLDDIALFYLQSRGFDRARAESVLTYAFAGEVLERMADPAARKLAMTTIFDRMPGGDALRDML